MEVPQRIPAEFVYRPLNMGSVSTDFEYRGPPLASWEEGALTGPYSVRCVNTTMPEVTKTTWSPSGPWSSQRVHVDGLASEKDQVYGPVPPQSWSETVRDWVSSFSGAWQEKALEGAPGGRFVADTSLPEAAKAEKQVFLSPQSERFVFDAPPQPVYERVVYVPAPVEARPPQQLAAVPAPQQVMAVPQPILIPLESEIVCRGHPSDRTELCFGCSVPPRQLKFDIVREEVNGWFGMCRSHRFKAVCKKCRAPMPPCLQIERALGAGEGSRLQF
ncbi:hypothetical protein Efla_006516 [Eimeria flavescens]